ncbi:MAG: DUF1501 domain-containing protein [Verrucomicrobia bacterium]|nr:DUF1501 domain-containing protein [Verrucomicrobiota bacterium]
MNPFCSSRRHFLRAHAFGLGGLALSSLLNRDGLLAAPVKPLLEPVQFDLKPKPTPYPPRAKAMISLLMIGGPSQMDLFDPKPQLTRYDGQPFPGEIQYDNAAEASSKVLGSPWQFAPQGQCGMELSELLPHLSSVADDLTLIRSMKTGVNNHGQSLYALNTGRITAGRPSLGSWLGYGLGCEAQNLPAYVALTSPHGMPLLIGENWTSGWLPGVYQGTVVRPTEPRILNLDPPAHLRGEAQANQLALLRELNREHQEQHPGELELQARIASYELAAHMQTAAREAFDLSSEPEHIRKLYGLDRDPTRDYGTRCLIARRLVERGVRFVQILNQGQSWDHHGAILTELPARCAETDQPSASLVKDLKQRGLLDSTVVHWGGEMGRLPVLQNDAGRAKCGRDHNTHGFSQWVAGGGFRAGYVHGETDEWGHRAIKDVVHHYDWHATLLRCFGLDHQHLTYKRNGTELTLTDQQDARVIQELLA